MRNRFKDAGITLEQIVDGTTGCNIWFHIDVTERKCFMSEEEQIDGSVVLNLSGIEDWATIPPDFYQLGGREVKGAYTCVFGSFIVDGQPYTLLESIPAQEVIDQGFFELLASNEGPVNKSAAGSLEKAVATKDSRMVDPILKTDNQLVDNRRIFPMSKAALVSKYKGQWVTIERDLQDASKNGLGVAKAGAREWWEHIAVPWAQSKNKFKERSDVADSPRMMMANLPTRVVRKLT
jgi:hypothetical protein